MSYCNTVTNPPISCGPNVYGQTQLVNPAAMFQAVNLIMMAEDSNYPQCAQAIDCAMRNPLNVQENCQNVYQACSLQPNLASAASATFANMVPTSWMPLGN